MENKRASSGFVGTALGIAMTSLQATHPEWFGNHPWILPVSLLVLFVGLLFWITQIDRIQKLLGLRQLENRSELELRSLSPVFDHLPTRLKIIEAHYGVEGISNPDVLRYLSERLRADSFAGLISAELFHGFDPVPNNPNKRLCVRYSFDGKEATIERPEFSWLILPEDGFLTAQIKREREHCAEEKREYAKRCLDYRAQILENLSDSVVESDPLIYPEFTDARSTTGSDKRELQAYITLVNRGGVEARIIALEPIEMDGKIVQFTRHRIAAPLLPKREAYFYPDVVTKDNRSASDREKDLFHLFCLDYLALGDSTICEASKKVTATYQDAARNLFEVTCELVFDPAAHADIRQGNRGPSPSIFTRNYSFRKVAKAVPSIDKGK